MQNKSLVELLQALEQEMLRLKYTEGSMTFYRRRWRKLLQFAQEKNETNYSKQLGIDFVKKYFQIFEQDFNSPLTQSKVQELRIIRMIGDFQLHHTILRRYYKHKQILTEPYFIAISHKFRKYCIDQDNLTPFPRTPTPQLLYC